MPKLKKEMFARPVRFTHRFGELLRTADEARYQKSDALVPLWETHLLPGKLLPARISRSFQAVE